MNEPHEPPKNLRDQVSAVGAALQRDAQQAASREAPRKPIDRRPLALLAVLAFAATLLLNLEALRGRPIDEDQLIDATVQSIEYVRGIVQAHWDSTGSLPVSLGDVGLAEFPFAYTATAQDFRIAALAANGDSIGYQSPLLTPPTEARR